MCWWCSYPPFFRWRFTLLPNWGLCDVDRHHVGLCRVYLLSWEEVRGSHGARARHEGLLLLGLRCLVNDYIVVNVELVVHVYDVYLQRRLIILLGLLLLLSIHEHFNGTTLKHPKLWLRIPCYYIVLMLHTWAALVRLEYRHLLIICHYVLVLLLLGDFLAHIFSASPVLIHSVLLIIGVKITNKQLRIVIIGSTRGGRVKTALIHHYLLIWHAVGESHSLLPLIVYHLFEQNVVIWEEFVVGGMAHPSTGSST